MSCPNNASGQDEDQSWEEVSILKMEAQRSENVFQGSEVL
jgi:hypothetical protein